MYCIEHHFKANNTVLCIHSESTSNSTINVDRRKFSLIVINHQDVFNKCFEGKNIHEWQSICDLEKANLLIVNFLCVYDVRFCHIGVETGERG